MMKEENCIFCKIALGQEKAPIVWADEKHVAFLSIFPNIKGFTVAITNNYYPSYNFGFPDQVPCDLTLASKKVRKLLDNTFESVGRTGMMLEGFGVDHVHTKLIPIHSDSNKLFATYEDKVSSPDYDRADDKELAAIAAQSRNSSKAA